MTPQRNRPQRTRPQRTTSVSLSPDEWPGVARWLQYWKNEWWKDDRSIPGLFIDQDAMKGIRQLIRKARRKSVENSMRALRMKGLLPGGDSVGSRRRPAPQAEGEEREHDDTQR